MSRFSTSLQTVLRRLGVPESAEVPVTGFRRWIDLPTTAALVLMMMYVAATTLRLVVVHGMEIPFWDQWNSTIPDQYLRHPFGQSNEHRIFVGRVFIAIDQLFFGGRNVFCFF